MTHTSHPTVGYLIHSAEHRAAWAPEFWALPDWAEGVGLLFAEEARRRGVRRLALAHIGRPTIRATAGGEQLPFGELGADGRRYRL